MTGGRIGIVELCRLTGCDNSEAVPALKAAGVPRSRIDKSYPKAEAVAALMAAKDPAKVMAHRARGKVALGTLTRTEAAAMFGADDPDLDILFDGEPAQPSAGNIATAAAASYSKLSEAKAAAELERVRKLKLANDRDEARLIDRTRAIKSAQHIVTMTRTALLSIPMKAAPKLLSLADEQEVAAIIEAEIRTALDTLANPDLFARKVIDHVS